MQDTVWTIYDFEPIVNLEPFELELRTIWCSYVVLPQEG